jgi:hypothetical protein
VPREFVSVRADGAARAREYVVISFRTEFIRRLVHRANDLAYAKIYEPFVASKT